MLTLDLLRYRVKGDCVEPVYLDATPGSRYFKPAEALLQIYRAHVGNTHADLAAAVDDFIGAHVQYRVYRGLAKMLEDNSVIEAVWPLGLGSPERIRMQLFTALRTQRPIARTPDLIYTVSAEEAFRRTASELGIDPATLHGSLYADLRENHVVKSVDPSLTASGLIERYNVALAQAMLYRTLRAEIRVWDNYKMLFKWIKLARLMHAIEDIHGGGYRILLDGPVSLFQHSERYGVNMARFLPALLASKRWELEATVQTSKLGEKVFQLNSRQGLRTSKKPEPPFDSTAEKAFYEKFKKSKTSWCIEREGAVLSHNGVVFIPDFMFRHPDGRTAFLEIVGFWTPEYLRRKISKLRRFTGENVIVAVRESLKCGEGSFTSPVITFKTRLLLKSVLPELERARTAGLTGVAPTNT